MEIYLEDKPSILELVRQAAVTVCDQWMLLLLAGTALVILILLLCWRNVTTSTQPAGVREREVDERALLFSLTKTAYKRKNMDAIMDMLTKSRGKIDTLREKGTGLTLFLCACISGQRTLVEYLLLKGADLDAVSADGDTALILATYACCTVKGADNGLLDLLACRGVNVNAQNSRGDTPLSVAALYGRTDVLSILLQYGADAHITDKTGCLPVDIAGYCGYKDSIKLLNEKMTHDYGRQYRTC